LTVVLLCPLGLLMGMPFTLGIRALHRREPRVVPWAWGINGTLSVLGAVLAAMLSIRFGFTVALLAGQLAYLLALVAVVVWPTRLTAAA